MAQELITVITKQEHTAIAVTTSGEEVLVYRRNLQRHQRSPVWGWETISIATQCRATLIEPEKEHMRRRAIEVLIIDP